MAKILEMPRLSPTMEEGQLASWHKQEGDAVAIDDHLADVETDKATMEFRSFDKGTLLKILVPPGSMVQLGQPVAILGEEGEDISELLSQIAGRGAAPSPEPGPAAPTAAPAPPPPAAAPAPAPAEAPPPSAEGRVRASPYVRKLARERDIDLHEVSGSGPKGRIIARDLEALPERPAAPPPPPPEPEAEVRPLSMMRRTIARRLTESKQNVPHFYLTTEVDAAPLARLREQINADLAASVPKGSDTKPDRVSLNDLLIKASAIALVRVPECNASFTPDSLIFHKRVDISVAVAIPDGLVTPVVRSADKKSVVSIAREVRDLAERARNKRLAPEEMTNGTFSVSNLGMFGIDDFAAVINPPEGAILAIGQVRDVPVVEDGEIVPGKRVSLTLSCDHRVVDGAVGARFLAELKALVERPMQMLVV